MLYRNVVFITTPHMVSRSLGFREQYKKVADQIRNKFKLDEVVIGRDDDDDLWVDITYEKGICPLDIKRIQIEIGKHGRVINVVYISKTKYKWEFLKIGRAGSFKIKRFLVDRKKSQRNKYIGSNFYYDFPISFYHEFLKDNDDYDTKPYWYFNYKWI